MSYKTPNRLLFQLLRLRPASFPATYGLDGITDNMPVKILIRMNASRKAWLALTYLHDHHSALHSREHQLVFLTPQLQIPVIASKHRLITVQNRLVITNELVVGVQGRRFLAYEVLVERYESLAAQLAGKTV